ncbi:ACT domain-containing protein, partial [Thermodesulfobacteriota bacterium]
PNLLNIFYLLNCSKYRLNFNTMVKAGELDKVVDYFGFKTVDDLIASVGYGKITPLQIIRKVTPKPEDDETQPSILNKIIDRVRKKKTRTGVTVRGVDDILIKFGKCCQPVPGDPITGYITRGYGVTVHRKNCVNALKMNPERQIDVDWSVDSAETYPVKIYIRCLDRVGLLADIAATISKNGANILSANTETREDKIVDSFFTISVEDTEQLRKVLAAIQKVKYIQEVRRIEG